MEEVHHHDVLRGNRAVRFQLVQPIALFVLLRYQRVACLSDREVERGGIRDPLQRERDDVAARVRRLRRERSGFWGRSIHDPELPYRRRACSGSHSASLLFSGAARGQLASANPANGKPRAAAANRRLSIQSLPMKVLVMSMVMLTAVRVTLTCAPAVKPGLWAIFRSVKTARPIAQRQKRRMPFSLPGINNVESRDLARFA